MARPHVGLILPNYGPELSVERLIGTAQAAEAAGFDSGWVTDHVLIPGEHAPIYGNIAESLVSLGYLSAQTTRLDVGVSALVVPQRNPLVALKQLTSLDFLSGGRIVTAVAAGWAKGEFEALGASFEQRGKLLDEWLRAALSVFEQMPGNHGTRLLRCINASLPSIYSRVQSASCGQPASEDIGAMRRLTDTTPAGFHEPTAEKYLSACRALAVPTSWGRRLALLLPVAQLLRSRPVAR